MDSERVDAAFELTHKRFVDHAVAIEPAPAAKCLGHDGNPEMGLAARPRAGVAFVLMGFIGHVEAGGLQYKSDAVEALFGRFKEFFTRANFERLPRAKPRPDVPQPIFIMGLPRSGTTLVEQVIVRLAGYASWGK